MSIPACIVNHNMENKHGEYYGRECQLLVHSDVQPGADMALYLARHGVRVEVMAAEIDTGPGEALLSYAADVGVDLIVMGAYGHARLHEVILGGATRTVLRSSSLPLWMAH
jgi:nucleotide-binding universal stress UspA family protein